MKKILPYLLIFIGVGMLAFHYLGKISPRVTLSVNCGVEAQAVVSAVAKEYEKEFPVKIDFTGEAQKGALLILKGSSFEKSIVREIIPFATIDNETYSAAVPSDGQQSTEALRFARYLAAPEKGGLMIQGSGGKALPGDTWAAKPDLILYSGGVNRPAIENLLSTFKEREGIHLTTVFNGCGILCASMKTMSDATNPRFPDAYFACDLCFVPPVAEHFSEVVLLTETDIGIAVPKSNPNQIKTLIDLAIPGLKIGLCNQKQSTLGYMTAGILKSSGLEKSIRKNVAVEVPTADFLITQMRSGALDAAIVYRVNAELQKEHIHFIKIDHQGARAVQPFSVRADSTKRQLATRLRDHFLAHPEAFLETGFTWRGNEGVMKSKDIIVPDWLRLF